MTRWTERSARKDNLDLLMNGAYLREQLIFSSAIANVSTLCCNHPRDLRGYAQDNSTHAILFVRSGVFARMTGTVREIVDSTQVLFAKPETTYRYFHPADCGDNCVVIRPSLSALSSASDEILQSIQACFARTSMLVSPQSALLLSELLQLLNSSEPMICIEESLLNILQELSRQISDPSSRGASLTEGQSATHPRDLTEYVKTLVIRTFPNPPSLNQMAGILNHSPAYISRTFSNQCGISIRKYITRLRLRTATTLMEQGSLNLSAVGTDCGFYDQSHFTREFARFYGISPSAYRRNLIALGQKRTRQYHSSSLR